MPRRTDIKSILVLGAGPIVIGQACEFDYSGTQACKVLKEDGYKVFLVNSNPATIMTDPTTADKIFIEPITVESVGKIIARERPDAILPTVGGQTALNCALDLDKQGILEKYNVEMLGAKADSIDKAENRERFNKAMAKIGLEVPRNVVVRSMEEAYKALEDIGLPAIIRPSFTLGGSGGGIAYTKEEFEAIVKNGLRLSPTNEVLIDESILGWKEYEMEVIRDKADNSIIVCSIENIDPMGIHTGDSITVAPALTLTDKEYQIMRDASIAVLREIGVETGGSNVQFAVNPETGKLVVIEMNPRVSRSSALASKATGYPIAKVAARLAVGYTLDEIDNDITKVTPASFEPTIDYIVTKIPRFTFEKFPTTPAKLSSQMKSVGEAMAIGRSFAESLQKGLISLEIGLKGLDEIEIPNYDPEKTSEENKVAILESLQELSPARLLRVAQAIRYGISEMEIHQATMIDPWFIEQISNIVAAEKTLKKTGLPNSKEEFSVYKNLGFSDAKIAELVGRTEKYIRNYRFGKEIYPVYKKVDTCAAEFESKSSYMYSTYEHYSYEEIVHECESDITNNKKVIILGGGPNRIGQGIEFDYACVHAAKSLKEEGIETIMINCNPETVSTDYDTSDKLYFEPLCAENVLNIIKNEMRKGEVLGVIVQFGGQTPLKLVSALFENNIPILGTNPDKIDLAEDRERFKELLENLNLRQPVNSIAYSLNELEKNINKVGYPVVVRPSNVLGGRAMEIVHSKDELNAYIKTNGKCILEGPILIDKFLEDATELDVDALADGDEVFVAGIMEHIEEAGIHSGDSACSIPTRSLTQEQINEVKESTIKLAKELNVIGLMNVQFAYQNNQLYVIEVNPRASRTVPFVAKATGNSVANIATKLMIGRKLSEFILNNPIPRHFSVKEAVFPFGRFEDVDCYLGPEMKSTGEAMGIDKTFGVAFYKAQEMAFNKLPLKGNILVSVKDQDKPKIIKLAKKLIEYGFNIFATKGTENFLKGNNIACKLFDKASDNIGNNDVHSTVKAIEKGEISLLINTSLREELKVSLALRRAAIMNRVPYITTIGGFEAFTAAVKDMSKINNDFDVKTVKEWINS
ncbi:carbamoyl-phosphate synthase large subunit [Allofrancisella guangzhouensis]|uniref:Carbamoyl phosphate synthase large chain n=1 Tax=Allofrancisella guangzhouensis TaxID=594679 RepID=A0A0A8E348_9GAMM|nr:carbamoyl-phosphate synthase large subunit [Allofrancisella guangzhouensis]AJC48399.1 carbamoyl phosphate synthase large subunit [Allofrancisella guangzhouensis]MBK2026694.1 carbamoyl-phosphate synthase large subunit [Allofrancisella guangzhouensis]MBK2043557.1 carbamoyl-phosphate synthase large subunit [Allofrancisella guangzhouensis]MBK2045489.1 carbamoyl-phosphate synthase large subunit [Allofrancisella guangzhouensis]